MKAERSVTGYPAQPAYCHKDGAHTLLSADDIAKATGLKVGNCQALPRPAHSGNVRRVIASANNKVKMIATLAGKDIWSSRSRLYGQGATTTRWQTTCRAFCTTLAGDRQQFAVLGFLLLLPLRGGPRLDLLQAAGAAGTNGQTLGKTLHSHGRVMVRTESPSKVASLG
jgi:hypothetical protein